MDLWGTHRCQTSRGLWPCTGPWWIVARCRWCRGSWWRTPTGPPAPRWWSGWRLWRGGCSRPSPPCPASWWRGCPRTSRLSWRGSPPPPPWGRISRFHLPDPHLSEAVDNREENMIIPAATKRQFQATVCGNFHLNKFPLRGSPLLIVIAQQWFELLFMKFSHLLNLLLWTPSVD